MIYDLVPRIVQARLHEYHKYKINKAASMHYAGEPIEVVSAYIADSDMVVLSGFAKKFGQYLFGQQLRQHSYKSCGCTTCEIFVRFFLNVEEFECFTKYFNKSR